MKKLLTLFGAALIVAASSGSAFAGQIGWGPWKKCYTNGGQFAYMERVGNEQDGGQYCHWAEFRINPRFPRSVRIYNLVCNGHSEAGDTVIGVDDEWQAYKFSFVDDNDNCNWNWNSETI